MPYYNKVTLMGNLVADPEFKTTSNNNPFCNFRMAVTSYSKKKKETIFMDFTAWGTLAEIICGNVTKGRCMLVEGRLQDDSYTAKDGKKVNKIKVIVEQPPVFIDRPDRANNQESVKRDDPGEQRVTPSEVSADAFPDSGSGDAPW